MPSDPRKRLVMHPPLRRGDTAADMRRRWSACRPCQPGGYVPARGHSESRVLVRRREWMHRATAVADYMTNREILIKTTYETLDAPTFGASADLSQTWSISVREAGLPGSLNRSRRRTPAAASRSAHVESQWDW